MTLKRDFSEAQVQELANLATLLKRASPARPVALNVAPNYAPLIARALELGVLPCAYQAKIIADMEAGAARVDAAAVEIDRCVEALRAKLLIAEEAAILRAAAAARDERRAEVEHKWNVTTCALLAAVVVWKLGFELVVAIGGAW